MLAAVTLRRPKQKPGEASGSNPAPTAAVP